MSFETYEEWFEQAEATQPTQQVGHSSSHTTRSFWEVNGVHVWEDDYMPWNWFKKPQATAYVDLQIRVEDDEMMEVIHKHGGRGTDSPYGETGFVWPTFERTDEEYDSDKFDGHMRRLFEFVKEYKALRL